MTSPNTLGASTALRRGIGAVLTAGSLLAACTSPAGPAATGTVATSAPASPAATAASTTSALSTPTAAAATANPPLPTAGAPGTPEPAPTLGTDTDLKSLMPTEIGGNAMTIEPASDPAGSFLILWHDEQIARDLLASLGKSEDDVDIVFSYTEADVPQIIVHAYRVAGVDGEALLDGMVDNYFAMFEEHGAVVTETNLGGKDVKVMSLPGSPPGGGEHFYAIGDVVFNISANPPEWVEEALSALP